LRPCDVVIRPAAPEDAAGIRQVHLGAFPTAAEADLVQELERAGDAVVSIVAEDEGIVGHVLFSRMEVLADGRPLAALGLAPVAVVQSRQSEGIGGALIEAGLSRADELGTDIVFLLGEPGYYRRFGFEASAAEPFASPYAGPYFQALALAGDYAPPDCGEAAYAPAFAGFE
jgi:putative acetyltransferase